MSAAAPDYGGRPAPGASGVIGSPPALPTATGSPASTAATAVMQRTCMALLVGSSVVSCLRTLITPDGDGSLSLPGLDTRCAGGVLV